MYTENEIQELKEKLYYSVFQMGDEPAETRAAVNQFIDMICNYIPAEEKENALAFINYITELLDY